MALIKCNISTCKYFNDGKCMSYDIDISKRDAVDKRDTNCETYRKRKFENYVTEIGTLNSYCDHEVFCDAKNCKFNDACLCRKFNIQIGEENKNKICKSFELEKY